MTGQYFFFEALIEVRPKRKKYAIIKHILKRPKGASDISGWDLSALK
jgi:hypothetical protein